MLKTCKKLKKKKIQSNTNIKTSNSLAKKEKKIRKKKNK